MASFRLTSCCGLGEIASISIPQEAFTRKLNRVLREGGILRAVKDWPAGKIIDYRLSKGALFFTSNSKLDNNYATQFAAGIKRHKLGTVQKFNTFVNPNTGNTITVYLWSLDKNGLVAYYKKQRITL